MQLRLQGKIGIIEDCEKCPEALGKYTFKMIMTIGDAHTVEWSCPHYYETHAAASKALKNLSQQVLADLADDGKYYDAVNKCDRQIGDEQ